MNWGTAPYAGLKATQIKEVWRVLSTALVKEKETKNTVRFQEVEGDDPPVIEIAGEIVTGFNKTQLTKIIRSCVK